MLGGYAPLPLRLVADALRGLSASQHARLCADLTATVASAPFGIVTYEQTGATALDFVGYTGMNGVGEDAAPTIEAISTGVCKVTWADAYTDDYGNTAGVKLRHGLASCHTSSARRLATVTQESPTLMRVRTFFTASTINARVTLVVW